MAMASIDLDRDLIERAKRLSDGKSNRAVVDLALRRLIAAKQKSAMVDGIAALGDPEQELGASVEQSDPET